MFLKLKDGTLCMGNPIKYTNMETTYNIKDSPKIGEHTGPILKEFLGYNDKEINAMKMQNIL